MSPFLRYALSSIKLKGGEEWVPFACGGPPRFLGSCSVLPNDIDYGRIQRWLHDYQNTHGHNQSWGGRRQMQVPIKCIDCLSGDTIDITSNEDYIALSYIWGAAQLDLSSMNSSHPARLPKHGVPQVVNDTITVVKSLGMRYLWVDRYCINEQDVNAKHGPDLRSGSCNNRCKRWHKRIFRTTWCWMRSQKKTAISFRQKVHSSFNAAAN